MLVQSQIEILSKLKNGEIEDDDELKNARRSMRKYVIRQLNSMSDLLEVMEVLGADQLGGMRDKGQIGSDHITTAATLTGELIKILDLPGIQPVPYVHLQTGKLEAVRRFSPTISEPMYVLEDKISSIVFAFYRDATPEEIATRDALEDLAQQIKDILSPMPRHSKLSLPELIAEGSKKWPDMRTRIDVMTSWTPASEDDGEGEETTPAPSEE